MAKFTARTVYIGACFVASSPTALAQTYKVVQITVPGSVQTYPAAINAAGTVLGTWYDSSYASHGFLFEDGVVTTLDVPKAIYTDPSGINDRGEVVGTYTDTDHLVRAFLYKNGKFRTISAPGTNSTFLSGINSFGVATGYAITDNGQSAFTYKNGIFNIFSNTNNPYPAAISKSGAVTGNVEPNEGTYTAFLYADGTVNTIPTNGAYTQSYDINRHNKVVGWYVNSDSYAEEGFTYEKGRLKSVSVPGAAATYFTGINDTDLIIGDYYDTNYNQFAFAYDQGVFTTLTVSGTDGAAVSVNASGLVTGSYTDTNGVEQTFLATPLSAKTSH